MRLLVLLFTLTLAAAAQEVRIMGWQTGCTTVTGFALFNDSCTPTNQLPNGTFAPPAIGEYFYDSNFGSRHTSMSGPSTFYTQAYSAVTAFSRTSKYAVRCGNAFIEIVDGKTGSIIRSSPYPAASCGAQEWSSLDDNVLYYYTSNMIRRYNVASNTASTVIQFDGTGGKPSFTSITLGGTADVSGDDWMTFVAPTQQQVCIIDLKQATPTYACLSYAADATAAGWTFVDFPLISKGVDRITGKRYVMVLPGSGANALYSFTDTSDFARVGLMETPDDGGTGNKDGIWVSGETKFASRHSDTGFTSDGRQFVATDCDIGSGRQECYMFFSYETRMSGRIANGGSLKLGRWVNVGGPYVAHHVGCARQAPVCVFSYNTYWNHTSNTARPLADTSPTQAHSSARLLVLTGDAGAWYKPIGTTRLEYWSEPYYYQAPRACLSQDGAYAWYSTNFGQQIGSTPRSAIIDVGYDPKNVRVTELTATTGTLRYSAPSSAACTRTLSVNADLSSPIINAESDGGGAVERSRALTGLTASTQYYTRVTCIAQNADLRFAAANNLQ
jgi:hypothetical protein